MITPSMEGLGSILRETPELEELEVVHNSGNLFAWGYCNI
jgi:hypothetical protein